MEIQAYPPDDGGTRGLGGAPLDPHGLMENGNPQQLNHKVAKYHLTIQWEVDLP